MNLKNRSLLTISLLSAAALLATTSCKKSNSSNTVSGSVTATIGGAAWASNYPTEGIYTSALEEFVIEGGFFKNGDSTAVTLQFARPFVVNTALSSDTALVDVGFINAATLAQYDGGGIAGHSVLTVTSWDSTSKQISGTFSGVLYNVSGGSDSLIIANGKFSTSYTAQ